MGDLQFPDLHFITVFVYIYLVFTLDIILLLFTCDIVTLGPLCPELENNLLLNKRAKEEGALNHPEPRGIALGSLACDSGTRIRTGATVWMWENPQGALGVCSYPFAPSQ